MSQPKIISVVNHKGGVGKSNTTRTICHGLNMAGERAVVLETDPQQTLKEWASQNKNGEPFKIYNTAALTTGMLNASINRVIEEEQDLKYLVIDGCALEFRALYAAITAADLVIIPTQPSPDDIIQLGEVIEITSQAQNSRLNDPHRPLQARTLINKAKMGTALLKEAQELLKNPNDSGITCMKTIIRDYEAIRRAAGIGKTAHQSGHTNAKIDAWRLTVEVEKILK